MPERLACFAFELHESMAAHIYRQTLARSKLATSMHMTCTLSLTCICSCMRAELLCEWLAPSASEASFAMALVVHAATSE